MWGTFKDWIKLTTAHGTKSTDFKNIDFKNIDFKNIDFKNIDFKTRFKNNVGEAFREKENLCEKIISNSAYI